MDSLFAESTRVGLRVTTGLVVSDRVLRADLLSTPARAYDEGRALAERWHGQGRTRYAVTPRFSLSASEPMLESCASLAKDVEGTWFTSHVNENRDEVAEVVRMFEGSPDYIDTYDRFGLVGSRSVFAHNVHVLDRELGLLAAQEAWVAHCPSSNSALGSGLFPMRRHIEAGVRVALGSDVGAGTGLSLLKEGLQAYFMQQLLQEEGLALTSAHLLYLATRAGADALGLDEAGDLSVGRPVRRGLGAAPGRQHPRCRPRARGRAGRRTGQGLHAGWRGRHRRGLGRRNAPARLTRADPAAPG